MLEINNILTIEEQDLDTPIVSSDEPALGDFLVDSFVSSETSDRVFLYQPDWLKLRHTFEVKANLTQAKYDTFKSILTSQFQLTKEFILSPELVPGESRQGMPCSIESKEISWSGYGWIGDVTFSGIGFNLDTNEYEYKVSFQLKEGEL